MLPRPFLTILPWLLVAFAVAAEKSVVEPAAFDAETDRLKDGRLLGWDRFDGHMFLAMGRELGGDDALVGRAPLLVGWNPAFAGFSSRLALASVCEGIQFESSQGPHSRITRIRFGLDEAWLGYPFDAFSWKAGLQAGWFRWRSHADAALAGEYLARLNAYPETPFRPEESWAALDSVTTVLTGLRFSLESPARRIRQEALFLRDTLYREPGLSLLWSINLAPLPGIEAGFAVEMDRLWEPEGAQSSTLIHNRNYISKDTLADTLLVTTVDSSRVTRYEIGSKSFAARLTVDPMTLFTGKSGPDRGGRFYLEAALLGWENVPPYYGNWRQRLHVNAGIHLPTFGFLDVLRLQAELWPEPQAMNSLSEIFERTLPLPGTLSPVGADTTGYSTGYSTSGPAANSHGWRGQLYLSRAVLPWLDLQGRVLLERRPKYQRDFNLTSKPIPTDMGPWTIFEIRVVARL